MPDMTDAELVRAIDDRIVEIEERLTDLIDDADKAPESVVAMTRIIARLLVRAAKARELLTLPHLESGVREVCKLLGTEAAIAAQTVGFDEPQGGGHGHV